MGKDRQEWAPRASGMRQFYPVPAVQSYYSPKTLTDNTEMKLYHVNQRHKNPIHTTPDYTPWTPPAGTKKDLLSSKYAGHKAPGIGSGS